MLRTMSLGQIITGSYKKKTHVATFVQGSPFSSGPISNGALYIIQLSPEVEVTSGKYPPLVTDTEGDNCFSICPINEYI